MLTLVRLIRCSLLESSAFKRYFIYAVGEILLVIIGLFPALQMNNWTCVTIDRKSEHRALFLLKKEFEDNRRQMSIAWPGENTTSVFRYCSMTSLKTGIVLSFIKRIRSHSVRNRDTIICPQFLKGLSNRTFALFHNN